MPEPRLKIASSTTSFNEMQFPASYINTLSEITLIPDIHRALLQAGIRESDLLTGDERISGSQLQTVLGFCSAHYQGDYPLPLHIGRHINMATHGLFGLAVISSPSFGDALEVLREYVCLAMPALKVNWMEEDGVVTIQMDVLVDIKPNEDIYLGVNACVLKNVMDMCKGNAIIESIELSYACDTGIEHYEEYFACPVKFSCEKNRVIISSVDLQAAMKQSDVHTARLLKSQMELQSLKVKSVNVWSNKVEGYCLLHVDKIALISKVEVAEYLGTTTRTLTRKLLLEENSFQGLVDSIIKQSADFLLLNTALTVKDVAEKLGFNCPKSFSRTFKRLHQMAPSDYRLQNIK